MNTNENVTFTVTLPCGYVKPFRSMAALAQGRTGAVVTETTRFTSSDFEITCTPAVAKAFADTLKTWNL